MIHTIMYMLLMLFTMMFSQLKHPLAMGFMLLIQTILICFITGMMFESFWFSYILFLIFLGGMLVLFIYITSLASNEMFNFSFKLFMFMMIMLIIMMIFMMLIDNMNFYLIFNKEIINNFYLNLNMENSNSIYKLYNYSSNWITFYLMNYLFFTLIVTVKITNFFYGPLRNLN